MKLKTVFRIVACAAVATLSACVFAPSAVLAAERDATATQVAQAKQSPGAPIALKKFTRKKVRSTRTKSSRRSAPKASLAQRAKAGKIAEDAASKKHTETLADVAAPAKLAPVVANANAFYRPTASATPAGMASPPPADASANDSIPENAAPGNVELAEATDINEVDRAAWAPKDVPKLAPAILDSRAEMLSEDSRWANTSTIGKIFVAIGALLTVGSAIRMFVA